MQVPAVPDWFKVGRIGLYVLAVVAMLVHLALFDDKSRERHHQALTRFSESIRSKSVNLFEMLTGAARLAHVMPQPAIVGGGSGQLQPLATC